MELRYPNETIEYRQARDALAMEEQDLIRRVKAVAEQRRNLPLGGRLKENYAFAWATNERLGEPVSFQELFRDKDSSSYIALCLARVGTIPARPAHRLSMASIEWHIKLAKTQRSLW